MRKSTLSRLAAAAALLFLPTLVTAPAQADPVQLENAETAPVTLGAGGWQVQSTALAPQPPEQVSSPDFTPAGWLPVRPDDAGAPGTVINALLQNGECPNVFYSENMRKCFGYQAKRGPVTEPRFAVPWWFRTEFARVLRPGQQVTLTIPGVVGEGDVWLNGHLVAGRDIVSGAYATRTFDVTALVRPGKNVVAIKMYPNDPKTMYTLSHLDWGQLPPDNHTGIQFPVQLRVTDAVTGRDAHVKQQTAADGSRSDLTVKTEVTNATDRAQRADVLAAISPPGHGRPIIVRKQVSVPARGTAAVALTPQEFPELSIHRPRLWWPYAMGDQPLYTLRTAVVWRGKVSAERQTFGIRSINTRLVGKSPQAPDGARIYGINGREFVFRAGGFDPDLFLRYDKADLAHQITLIKSLGLNGIRVEGHDMPQDFYDQMDRAGILVMGGFLCCDSWEPAPDAQLPERDYRILYESAVGIGKMQRHHPSVFTYGWSDTVPLPRQESETLRGFAETDFDVPVVAAAQYKSTPALGPSGEKMGPYDWVPPAYWYDTTHFNPADPSRTNAGGSWALDSEQSAGHTVPTLDSINRFLSPEEKAKLWQDPEYHHYHANYQPGHGGYRFGTLYSLDTSIRNRYGPWSDLDSYLRLAHVANYENVRSQFEAFIAHSTDKDNPSTGTVYWQLNKGWPTLLWSLYNNDGDQPGSFYGAQKANKPLHALFTYDDNTVVVNNFGGTQQDGLSVRARVRALDGTVLDDQQAGGISLPAQGVRTAVLAPKVPAATTPPAKAQAYFVELELSRGGVVVDRNVYWRSTQPDVVDWPATLGKPQATMVQYAALQDLQTLPKATIDVSAKTERRPGPNGADSATMVTVTNTSSTPTVAFSLRADLRRGSPDGTPLPGDNQVRAATWDENLAVLWPGQSQTLTTSYRAADLGGATPVVTVAGWNVPVVSARAG